MFRLITLIIATACLTGCGLKGPLYLPDTSAPVVVKQPIATEPAATDEANSSSSSSSSLSSAGQ